MLKTFFDQLAQRLAVLSAKLLSTSFDTLQVSHEADHLSQLEDLARSYEEDGKPEIAASVRRQAARLSSNDLAAQSVEIVAHVSDGDPPRITDDTAPPRLPGLPGRPASPQKRGARKVSSLPKERKSE